MFYCWMTAGISRHLVLMPPHVPYIDIYPHCTLETTRRLVFIHITVEIVLSIHPLFQYWRATHDNPEHVAPKLGHPLV